MMRRRRRDHAGATAADEEAARDLRRDHVDEALPLDGQKGCGSVRIRD